MNQTLEYLKFLLKSTNQHGVHSPFIFSLVTNCFYTKTKKNHWVSFLKIKKNLLENKKTKRIIDIGNASKVFKSDILQANKITKIARISNRKAKLLIRVVNYFQPKTILEFGTSIGLAIIAIKIGSKNATFTTLESCPETTNITQELLKKNNFKNLNRSPVSVKETLLKTIENNQFDFIYFDANQKKKSTLTYFEACLQTKKNNSVWIFDNIYRSKEMKEAWLEIKKHPKVKVTVDIFHWGIVFFREEQAKEHFKIRV